MESTGLRERKKRDTYRALSRAAQELVHSRGLEAVTIEEIAEAAGVSVRTFFNYFSCKEEAVVGTEPTVLAEMAEELLLRPEGEDPVVSVRAVLGVDDDATRSQRHWQMRNELVERYPALLPRHLTTGVQVETVLADALARRMGVDPLHDLSPRVLVASILAAIRGTLIWWGVSDRSVSVSEALDIALAHIVATPERTQ